MQRLINIKGMKRESILIDFYKQGYTQMSIKMYAWFLEADSGWFVQHT